MIWISRGRGGWALWIPILLFICPLLLDDYLHWIPKGKQAAQAAVLGSLLLAGILVTVLGFLWNSGSSGPGRRTIDSASGLEYIDRSAKHSFYLLPMQYWGLFYCSLAIAILALKR